MSNFKLIHLCNETVIAERDLSEDEYEYLLESLSDYREREKKLREDRQ